MTAERCKHDEYLSICIVCMHDAEIAALRAELAEIKRECEWPHYKRLAEENGNSARALSERVEVLEAALRETYALVKRNFVTMDPSGMYTNEVPPGAQVRIKAALREHIDAALAKR